jgi:hypothetical protein
MTDDPNKSARKEDPKPRHSEGGGIPNRTPPQQRQEDAADDETQDDLPIAS